MSTMASNSFNPNFYTPIESVGTTSAPTNEFLLNTFQMPMSQSSKTIAFNDPNDITDPTFSNKNANSSSNDSVLNLTRLNTILTSILSLFSKQEGKKNNDMTSFSTSMPKGDGTSNSKSKSSPSFTSSSDDASTSKSAGSQTTNNQSGSISPSITSSDDFSRQTLASTHGWGAQGGGTTGGSKANSANVYTVTNRDQLIAALGTNNAMNGSNSTPKIIQIKGTIDMNIGADGKEMTKAQFGNENAQIAHDMANVGSNTTIIGLGSDAKIINGGLNVSKSHNDIIRNIDFQSPSDFFPGKDAEGNPHGRIYSIEAKGTSNLWVDHNSFSDGQTPAGSITGDQLDFTDSANFGTVSYNKFSDHNKGMLIGSSDSMSSDAGKLNVTIDHNQFSDLAQRAPRVRFGHVEVANNLYTESAGASNKYQYSLGVGKDATLTSQNNAYELPGIKSSQVVKQFGTGSLTDSGSLVNGKSVDLSVAAKSSGPGAGAIANLDATTNVASIVTSSAGAGNIGNGD